MDGSKQRHRLILRLDNALGHITNTAAPLNRITCPKYDASYYNDDGQASVAYPSQPSVVNCYDALRAESRCHRHLRARAASRPPKAVPHEEEQLPLWERVECTVPGFSKVLRECRVWPERGRRIAGAWHGPVRSAPRFFKSHRHQDQFTTGQILLSGQERLAIEGRGMIERFTSSARLSLSFAGYESIAGGRCDISPSHVLLAIMYLYPAVVARLVRSPGDLRVLRQRLIEAAPEPVGHMAGYKQFQLDDECRRVLLNAGREAKTIWRTSMPFHQRLLAPVHSGRWRGRWHVDPHHILLGVLGEHRSTSSRLLMELGVSAEAVREMIGHSYAPTTVEASTVNSLVVVTGEFVDLAWRANQEHNCAGSWA